MKILLILLLFASNCFAQFLPQFNRQPEVGYQINLAHPDAQGLVGFWLFNEGLGMKAYDLTPYGNDGTLTNMDEADWVVGRDGWALNFDDTEGEFIQIPSGVTLLTAGQPFTISWWEKINADTDNFPARFILAIDGDADEFSIIRSNNGAYIPLHIGLGNNTGGTNHQTPNGAPTIAESVGIWRHWVVTGVDPVSTANSDFVFYTDGIQYPTQDGGSLVTFSGNQIGYDGQDNGANCQMSNIMILKRQLPDKEVVSLFVNQYAMFEQPPGRILAAAAAAGAFSPGRLPQIIKNNEKKNILERLSGNDSLYVSLD